MSGSNREDFNNFGTDGNTCAAENMAAPARPVDISRVQAAFAELPNTSSRKRPRLTRSLGFIVSGNSAVHFLNHSRGRLQQSDPQLYASLDTRIAAHPIFREFDRHPSTIWRILDGGPFIQTTTSYAVHRLRVAIDNNVPYRSLPRNLVATPLDGNTMGGKSILAKKDRTRFTAPSKTEELSPASYAFIACHRAHMDKLSDDKLRAAYARNIGFADVTLADGSPAKVHLVTADVPLGFKGYVQWSADMSMDKLLCAAPGIDPTRYTIAISRGRPVIPINDRIDLGRLIWLIANRGGDGLHLGNVLGRIEESTPGRRRFRWLDGDFTNCHLANLTVEA